MSRRRLSDDERRKRNRERAKRDLRVKLHLYAGEMFGVNYSACDIRSSSYSEWRDRSSMLDERQMVWLPVDRQCAKCHRELAAGYPGHGAPDVDYTTCDTHSATPLMLTVVELVCHAFGSFCAAVDESGTHADRGCWFGIDSDTCWCGRMTLTNPTLARHWVEHDGDKLLRGIGWWPEREWRSLAGDEYITARVHGAERVP